MMDNSENPNFQIFRDCLATSLISKSTNTTSLSKRGAKGRRTGRKKSALRETAFTEDEPNDAEELADFIDYVATEIFTTIPPTLRTLTHSTWLNTPALQTLYPDPLPPQTAAAILVPLAPEIGDSLSTYNLLPPHTTLSEFLSPILISYREIVTAAPPAIHEQKKLATECEICERGWIPLTYHHLIPKDVHAKVLKRGWHTEDHLMDAAWLCRACHSFVHSCATNDELAKEWYTVDRLLQREDVTKFRGWIGKVRWKAR